MFNFSYFFNKLAESTQAFSLELSFLYVNLKFYIKKVILNVMLYKYISDGNWLVYT